MGREEWLEAGQDGSEASARGKMDRQEGVAGGRMDKRWGAAFHRLRNKLLGVCI